MISSPGDAIVIIPMIKGFIDSSLKNDESILKLVQVFQKFSTQKVLSELFLY